MDLTPIYNHVGPFLLVLARLAGLVVFAPVIGSPVIPWRVRIMLVLVFSLALYPTLPAEQQTPVRLDLFSLGVAVALESLIGVIIGLIAALPMYAAQLGGLVVGQQVGLGLGMIYNPALDTEADVVGQLLLFMALAVFIVLGGLEAVFLALAHTFSHIPLAGARISDLPVDLLLGLVAAGFDIALRVSAPVLAILLIETIVTAVLMKTMPQLNIMSLGFAIKIVISVLVLAACVLAVEHVFREDVAATLDALLRWAQGPAA